MTIGRRELLSGLAASGLAARAAAAASRAPVDLSGVWDSAWYTKVERPKAFKDLVATPAEAEAYEAPRRKLHGELGSKGEGDVGQDESEFPDNGPGLARIDGQIRTSWIVDPPDGKIPWTPAARKQLSIGAKPPAVFELFDNPEQRDTEERCLMAPGVGPPITNAHDANLLAFVQAPGWLAIVGEKSHDLRVIELPGGWAAGAPAPPVDDAHGRSVGRWDGQALVAVTSGFRAGVTKVRDDFWISGAARVTERFARTSAGLIRYDYQVEDPELLTRPWRAEMVLRTAQGRMFEYACHEGNYALRDILAAARRMDAAKTAAAAGR